MSMKYHIAHSPMPETIPTIMLPAKNHDVEKYLQDGWHIVGKLSMTESSQVNNYVVLQPVKQSTGDAIKH